MSYKRTLTTLLWAAAGAASGATLGPSNLLVSGLSSGTLFEYTPQGALVQQFATPDFSSGFHDLRDIATGPDGRVHMYNGTFAPALTTLDPVSGQITNRQATGWSTINNISYGGIGVWQNSVFVTDMRTGGDGDTGGIVRFDLQSQAWSRLTTPFGQEYTDLTMGLDGLLYALGGGVDVFDPASGTFLRHITLSGSSDVRGIAVDGTGSIFAADWNGSVSRYSPTGTLQLRNQLSGESLTDIDVNWRGELVVGSRFGRVLLSDGTLQDLGSFNAGALQETLHVAFAQAVPEPSALALLLAGVGVGSLSGRLRRAIRRA